MAICELLTITTHLWLFFKLLHAHNCMGVSLCAVAIQFPKQVSSWQGHCTQTEVWFFRVGVEEFETSTPLNTQPVLYLFLAYSGNVVSMCSCVYSSGTVLYIRLCSWRPTNLFRVKGILIQINCTFFLGWRVHFRLQDTCIQGTPKYIDFLFPCVSYLRRWNPD